jgi:hypothetical protein
VRDTNVGDCRWCWSPRILVADQATRLEAPVTEPSLEELEGQRRELLERLAEVGDFRRGSVHENYRRCGKPNCVCATPGHPGHGPRLIWTRTGPGGKTRARQIKPEEEQKVRAELATYHQFAKITDEIVEVNEAICEARPPGAPQPRPATPPAEPDGERGGSTRRSRRSSPPR